VTNLAIAVFAGVVLSALGFAWKSAKKVNVTRVVENYVAVRIESFDDALYGVQ
jgi:MFS superfamily sulfate permease-like transporter